MMSQEPQEKKSKTAEREEIILAFWEHNSIFRKSLEKKAKKGEYIFYDGPPFATGLPHYGHISVGTIKDVVARYKTMRGYSVPRRWGWDCHGLPIENIVEKEIGSKHKKDIVEGIGVAKFNELCRSKVLEYADEWKRIIPRLGRWADMENPYFTMSKEFMESVWWVFKQLYDKKLVYEDYRSMHICPRCETTLSQGEVAEGYKEIRDLSVTAEFKMTSDEKTSFLAWTTTPWTLPGNVALAVGPNIEYSIIEKKDEGVGDVVRFVVAHERVEALFGGQEYIIKETKKGSDFVGSSYEPLFNYYSKDESLKNRENGWKVYAADFVTADSGTGIVHITPAYGADDMALGKKENLPFIQHVGMDGIFKKEVIDFAGLSVKPIEDHQATDVEIVKYLAKHNLLFSKEKYLHSYPHCWRCDTPLINYATSSWFVNVESLKTRLNETATSISWSPEHIKEGRFGKWLEGARDWSISRQRFWASVIPLWRCDRCAHEDVFGSIEELKVKSGTEVEDLHKHIVDEVTYTCTCGGTMVRIPDVLDTWFDSGSMPYGQAHYPFENKERFEKTFPAHFITEAQDQTRAWFYYLHVLSGALFGTAAFQSAIVNGIVLAEDGKKMSKKLQNYPDPMIIANTYGADALRLYMMSSPVVRAENLNFSEEGVKELSRKVIDRLLNTHSLYALYKDSITHESTPHTTHFLDRWIVSLLNKTQKEVTLGMEQYSLERAARPLIDFVDDLSTWYVRRSRERLKGENEEDKKQALGTLLWVLREYSKMSAPFIPFIAESLWQELKQNGDEESVHLAEWSMASEVDEEVLQLMAEVRTHVSLGLEVRMKAQIPVRQPLATATLRPIAQGRAITDEYITLIKDELNVKEVTVDAFLKEIIILTTALTPELVYEGEVRELLRAVQDMRKENQLVPSDRITLSIAGDAQAEEFVKSAEKDLLRVAGVLAIVHLTETQDSRQIVIGGRDMYIKIALA